MCSSSFAMVRNRPTPDMPPNQRLQLARAPFAVFALDCLEWCTVARPRPCLSVVVAAQLKR